MTDQPVPSDERRPFGVLVLAGVQFLRSALLVAQMLGYQSGLEWLRMSAQLPEPTNEPLVIVIARGLALGLILASVLAGLGLLAGRRWGWIAAIVLSGMALFFAIAGWWDGQPTYLSMAINVVAVFYLNQREVRAVFDRPAATADGDPT